MHSHRDQPTLRVAPLAITVLLLGSVALALAQGAAAQGVFPDCTLGALEPSEVRTTPTPSSQGSASFSAQLTGTKPLGGIMSVTLTVSISTAWPAVVAPGSMSFVGAGGSETVKVNVVVPQATSAAQVGDVTLTAQCIYMGTSKTRITQSQVLVNQYFRVVPESQQAFMQVNPGQPNIAQLKMYNQGNGLDTFSIEIRNNKQLTAAGWSVVPSRLTVANVPPDDFDSIQIKIQRPVTFMAIEAGKLQTVDILIKSDNAATAEQVKEVPFLFTIYEKGFFVPGFDMTLAILALAFLGVALHRRRLGGGPERQRRL